LLIGSSDVLIVVLFAVGGAANLALWTAVTARLLVRRPDAVVEHRSVPTTEAIAIAGLSIGAVGGLVLAGPIAATVTDPAAEAAFGVPAGLAAGWSVAIAGTGFAVPMVAAIVLIAAALAVAVTRSLPAATPRPYLAGANVSGTIASFHGSHGQAIQTRSGGFYWGAARQDAGRPSPGRLLTVGGWLSVGLLVAAGLLASLAPTPEAGSVPAPTAVVKAADRGGGGA
jgi:hypothetical protein